MKQYIFRDGTTFSSHTSIEGLAELVFDGLMNDAESEEEEAEIVAEYADCGEEKDRELIEEIYSYEILEPTPKLIAEWEQYHDTQWEYDVQSYDVLFDMGNPCVVHVNVYREGETLLTREEIVLEAIGYAEEVGIPLIARDEDDAEIVVLQLGTYPTKIEEEK